MGISSHRLVDDLAGHLRSRLLAGQYEPHERLSESGIAVEYNVARPTARSAIDALVADGLLVREAHLPPHVPLIAINDLPEIFGILEVVERMALGRILALAEGQRNLSDTTESTIAGMLNRMVVVSGSDRLARVHRQLTFELLLAVRQQDRADHAVDLTAERHGRRLLLDALAQGSASVAARSLGTLQQLRRAPLESLVEFSSAQNSSSE